MGAGLDCVALLTDGASRMAGRVGFCIGHITAGGPDRRAHRPHRGRRLHSDRRAQRQAHVIMLTDEKFGRARAKWRRAAAREPGRLQVQGVGRQDGVGSCVTDEQVPDASPIWAQEDEAGARPGRDQRHRWKPNPMTTRLLKDEAFARGVKFYALDRKHVSGRS